MRRLRFVAVHCRTRLPARQRLCTAPGFGSSRPLRHARWIINDDEERYGVFDAILVNVGALRAERSKLTAQAHAALPR